jgi:parvulin-like peptidyl-prolyl isomerase
MNWRSATTITSPVYLEGATISGLSQEQVRAVFERQALRELMRDEITKDIPPEEEQVNVRHILVATEEEAQDVMAALAEGESFAELARAVSIDTGSASSGGELGWAGSGQYVAEFEDAVFNAEVGAIVGPVQSQYGYHIIQVHAREVRPLSADELDSKRNDAFNEWLSGLRDAEGAQVEIYDYADRTPSDPTVFELGLASAS